MFCALVLCLGYLFSPLLAHRFGGQPRVAVAELLGSGRVGGLVQISQSGTGRVLISGKITGLAPGAHGFHVHQDPVKGSDCKSAGGHFNPFGHDHGSQSDPKRHVGDLGNIIANRQGVAEFRIEDHLISLSGKTGVVGRAFVVHEKPDDLGRGRNAESAKTGNAGSRVGCGTIRLLPSQGRGRGYSQRPQHRRL